MEIKIGKNVSNWLNDLQNAESDRKVKVAGFLLRTSENYFDDRKVPLKKRRELVSQLAKLTSDKEPVIRECVAQLVALLKVWSNPTKEILKTLLCDTNDNVRTTAVWATGNIGKEAAELAETLIMSKQHPNRDVRWRVSWAFCKIAAPEKIVRETLVEMTSDIDSLVKMYAFEALGVSVVSVDKKIIKIIKKGLSDKDGSVQGGTSRAIVNIEGQWPNSIKRHLKSIIVSKSQSSKLEEVLATCKVWPKSVNEPYIKSWLDNNRGYWWVEELLSGNKI